MRILVATGLFPPEIGGPATYSKLLAEELPKRGLQVDVLPFSSVRRLPKAMRHLAYMRAVLWRARKADVIYAQDAVSVGLPAMLAALVSRKPFLVRIPGDYAWEQGRQRFGVEDELDEFQNKKYGRKVEALRFAQRFVIRRARAVVVPSEYLKKIVAGWGAKHVEVIYSSVETLADIEAPQKRPRGFLVVSSGRRVPWKHFDGIERAVAREKSWHFHLAENLPRAEALGWVKAADVFVLNSTYEGLSHALIEAMLLGTPVVATAAGGNPELIEDGATGFLVPQNDDEALHAALKRVEDDPMGAVRRATAAQMRARKLFSTDATASSLIELLHAVCAS